MTTTASAYVPTTNGARYVQQLGKHWAHKMEVELSDERGVFHFPDAVATMTPDANGIAISLTSAEAESVERLKDVIAKHIDRFAFREAPLSCAWA